MSRTISLERNITLMGWHNFFTEFRPYAAVNAIYFAAVAGSYTEAMAIFSMILLTSLLCEVPTGMLSDKIGRRATLIWGSLTFAASIFLFATAENLTTLLIGGALAGLSDALVSGNNNALVFESLKQAGQKDKFNVVLGKLNAIFQISLGISALLGGILLYLDFSLRDMVWIGFASQLFCIIISFFIREPDKHTAPIKTNIYADLREALTLFYNNRKLRITIIANAIQFGLGEAAHKFSPAFFGTVWPVWFLNAFSSIRNVFGTAGYWMSGSVINKWGDAKTLLVCSALMNAIGIVAGLINNLFSPLLVFLNNLFYGINDVAKEHILQHEFDDRQRATMGSLAQFFGSCLGVVASLLLGVMADMFTPAIAFLGAMFLRTPVIWLYWLLLRKKRTI